MSILQYPEAMNASDLQIWNNAAFDNGDSEDPAAPTRSSWSPLKPIFVNRSEESIDSFSSKENQSPVTGKTPAPFKTPAALKPLHPNGAIADSKNLILKQSVPEKPVIEEEVRDEGKIDQEIEEIQREISLLSSKLEALRLEKAEQKQKLLEKRGRVVSAKFMDQKQSGKIGDGLRKIEESSLKGSARNRIQRRGLSLGPSEISAGVRRGTSLGPAEIAAAGGKYRQWGKPEMKLTPVQQIQNRRKSCFWKLQDIDEEDKVTKARGKSSSISPKSRKTISKTTLPPRQAVTTIGSKKLVKKDDGVLSTINPRKLFKDGGDKSVPAKKPLIKPGRVVPSRYNQGSVQSSAIRKRSLPENEKDDLKRCDKKRSSSESSGSLTEMRQIRGSENRVKKRWEIPSEIVVHNNAFDIEESPDLVSELPEFLPRIRTLRCTGDSPRDSGPAKRVVDLIGRKTFFCVEEEGEKVESPVCLALSFAEEGEEM